MTNKSWKRTMTSAAVLALAGAGLIGSSDISIANLGVNVESLEAATGTVTVTPSASILAFDQYVISGSEYAPLKQVRAFGTDDGKLIDLTGEVQVVDSTVNVDIPGRYNVTYQVTSPLGDIAEKTVVVTVGLDPTQGLHIYETSLQELEDTIASVGLKDEDQAVLQEQIQLVRETIEVVRGDLQNVELGIEERDEKLPPVREDLLTLQESLDALYSYAVELYSTVNDLDEAMNIHKELANKELSRLKKDLAYNEALYNNTLSQLEATIDATGDQEQVANLQNQVNDLNTRFQTLLTESQKRINEVSAQVKELGRLEGQSEGRDKILQDLLDTNETEIKELEDQIQEVFNARDAEIKALESEINDKLNQLEIHTIQRAIEDTKEFYNNRAETLESRLATLNATTESLDSENAVFEARLTQLQNTLASLRSREKSLSDKIHEQIIINDELEDIVSEGLEIEDDTVIDEIVDGIVNEDNNSNTPIVSDTPEEEDKDGIVEEVEVPSDADIDLDIPTDDTIEEIEDEPESNETVVEDNVIEENEEVDSPVEDTVVTLVEDTVDTPVEENIDVDGEADDVVDEPIIDEVDRDDLNQEVIVGEDLGDNMEIVDDELYEDLEFVPFSTFSTVPEPETYSTAITPSVASLFSFTPVAEESTTPQLEASEGLGAVSVQTFEANDDATTQFDVIEHEGYVEYVDNEGNVVGYERRDGEQSADDTPVEEAEEATQDIPVGETPVDESDTTEDGNVEQAVSEESVANENTEETPSEPVANEYTETAKDGSLPQTGASFGTLAAAGISAITGLGAFAIKKFRK